MKTINDFEPLLPAEQLLLYACKNGEVAKISQERPSERTADNEIRAEFLRSLILTEKDNINPKGIQFQGSYVSGNLDFENCETKLYFWFCASLFIEEINLRNSRLAMLNLSGSYIHGLNANGVVCGDVFLRCQFQSIGEVNFINALIGSSFDCADAKFENMNGYSIICDGAHVNGNVFLKRFYSNGEVNFVNTKVKNNFECIDAEFSGVDGLALNCDGLQVEQCIFFDNVKIQGTLDLTSVATKDLKDEYRFWMQENLDILLNGFVYEHIYSNDLQAEKRKKWLAKMPEFKPQPYKQLAKVLRDMGHVDDAAEIMIEYHDKRSREFKSRLKKLFFGVYKLFSDYGYSPSKVVKWMASIWLFCGIIYWVAAMNGIFAPSNPIIIQEGNYTKECRENWYLCGELPPEYTTFQPFWYSLDVILPVVDLQMEKDWGVKIDTPVGWSDVVFANTTVNSVTRWIIWIENLMGWALSLILVAILSGLAKNEKD